MILGGAGSDTITTTTGNDFILGDNGNIVIAANGVIESVSVSDLINGTDDIINAGNGNNIIAGAVGDDEIEAGINDDIILGDGGSLTFTAGVLTKAESTGSEAGNDTITALDGHNVILGGAGSDTVTTGGGVDIILGDTGEVLFEEGLLKSIITNNGGVGVDNISSGVGDDVVFAGLGSDVVNSGADNDIVIADTGMLEHNSSAELKTLIRNDVDPILGGNDIVNLGAGNDIGLGGAGFDKINGQEGSDSIFGDFVTIKISSTGIRDFQSTLPLMGAGDELSGGSGFDTLVGGYGFDYFDGSLTTDIIIGNYGRIKDADDFASLLVVSDPTGREVIASSLFDIYVSETSTADAQSKSLVADKESSSGTLLRTDTALRLIPLLNSEDFAKLSDSELKDFLRNLPLIAAEDGQRRPLPASEAEPEPEPEEATLSIKEGEMIPISTVDIPIIEDEMILISTLDIPISDGEVIPILTANTLLKLSFSEIVDSNKFFVPSVEEDEIIPISVFNIPLISDSISKNGNQLVPEKDVNEFLIPLDASMSSSLAAGLLFVSNVAGQRGWKLCRVGDEDKVIQGDLEKLRKMQSSRKYSIWQRQDLT